MSPREAKLFQIFETKLTSGTLLVLDRLAGHELSSTVRGLDDHRRVELGGGLHDGVAHR